MREQAAGGVPQAVVFDIGNVLLEWQPERFYDTIMDPADRARMFAEVDLHAMNELVDLGGDFGALVAATAEAHPEWTPFIRRWQANWLDMASPEIPHSIRLLRALRARGIPVFALSNFGTETFAMAQGHYPVLTEFDRYFISGHMGVTKPDPEIYRRLEEESGIAPGLLLFADDRANNIEAAAARGWQTHLFDGPEGWARRLVAEGLLPEDAAL